MKKLISLLTILTIASSLQANEVQYVEHHNSHHQTIEIKKPITPTILKMLITGTLAVASGAALGFGLPSNNLNNAQKITLGVIGVPTVLTTGILTIKYIVQLVGQIEQRATAKN